MSIYQARLDAEREAKARRLGLPLWQYDMAMATPDSLIRDIVDDGIRRTSPTSPVVAEQITGADGIGRIVAIPPDLREVVALAGWGVLSRAPAPVIEEAKRLLTEGMSVAEAGSACFHKFKDRF